MRSDSKEELNQHPISAIVAGLKKAFEEAVQKKEAHLASVAKRKDLLTEIGRLTSAAHTA